MFLDVDGTAGSAGRIHGRICRLRRRFPEIQENGLSRGTLPEEDEAAAADPVRVGFAYAQGEGDRYRGVDRVSAPFQDRLSDRRGFAAAGGDHPDPAGRCPARSRHFSVRSERTVFHMCFSFPIDLEEGSAAQNGRLAGPVLY